MASDQLASAAALRGWNDQLEALGSGIPIGVDGISWDGTGMWGNIFSQRRQGRSHRVAHSVRMTAGGIQGNQLDPSTDTSDTPADIPTAPPGTLLQVRRVDEVYDQIRGGWVARDAMLQEKPVEKDAYEAYAFTLTRRFDQSMISSTSTVDIRSEWLRQVGKDVVGAVSGISWTAKPLKIDPQVLIAFLPALEDHASKLRLLEVFSADDSSTLDHLEFLITTLRSEYEATLSELSSLLLHGEINFELIYALFVPGSILYFPCPVSGAPRAARLVSIDMQVAPQLRYWQLEVKYIEYDSGSTTGGFQSNGTGGSAFGFATLPLTIFEFKGAKKITNLPVFPFRYFVGAEELKARLVERGRKWVELQGMHHKYHSGIAFHSKNGNHVKVNCNSRIMVDWVTFAQTVPNYQLPSVTKTLDGEEINRHAVVHTTGSVASFETPRNNTLQEWSDERLLLCSTIVYGFSLMDKLWLEFNIENVESFVWNDEPFENLVLAHNEKKLVKSLVEAHSTGGAGFDDFVKGKGQGLVINLFGNPGVGKTLTAEATSEHVRKPLYVVGAGDLGTKAAVLDANLTRIFSISSTWDAVVLIDEADVFLEERSLHDLERNAMVAVFLRQLEYFRGILFLTTNRVRTFDEAFQSRIHVSLRYQDLTDEARQHIWAAFLKKAHASEATEASRPRDGSADVILTEAEIRSLGARKVNGRQIKNVVRTASALARSGEESMNYAHLVQVLDLMEAFELDRAPA